MFKARSLTSVIVLTMSVFFFISVFAETAALASPGLERLREDVRRGGSQDRAYGLTPVFQELISRRSLFIILAGGAAASWAWEEEEIGLIRRYLDRPALDVGCDYGDAYGSGVVQGVGILGLLAAGRLTGKRTLTDAGQDLSYSLLTSSAVVWALKIGIDRERPNGGKYSFPSGHTAVAFSTVPVISHHFGWQAGLMTGTLATFTAMGRMEENRHYLSDVIFGASIGLAAGYATVARKEPPGLLNLLSLSPDHVGIKFRF